MDNQTIKNSSILNKNADSINNDMDTEKIRKQFYDADNKLAFPRTADCYFNWRSIQSNNITLNTRLQELGFLLSQGFDLKECMLDYNRERDSFSGSSLSQTLIFYIMYIRYRDYYHFISEILNTLSENKLIQLFLDELSLVYDPLEHAINCKFWSESDVMTAAKKIKGNQTEKDKLITVINTSLMYNPPKPEESEKK